MSGYNREGRTPVQRQTHVATPPTSLDPRSPLYFPGTGTAQVTIEVISAAGVKTGEITLQLEAGVRLSELLVDLIASTAGQVGGSIRIRSDQGLVAQELFGTSGLGLLSAVPPTLSRVAPGSTQSRYARWENGPSTDPGYFPIGVWLQSPSRAQQYKGIGINLYVGLWMGPTQLQLTELEAADMPVFAFQNGTGLFFVAQSRHSGLDPVRRAG